MFYGTEDNVERPNVLRDRTVLLLCPYVVGERRQFAHHRSTNASYRAVISVGFHLSLGLFKGTWHFAPEMLNALGHNVEQTTINPHII